MNSQEIAEQIAMQNQTAPRYLVYGLFDPRTGELRYVGKSHSGMRRPKEHLRADRLKAASHKNSWLKALLAVGRAPEIRTLAVLAGPDEVSPKEVELIAFYKSSGARLTNMTDGGEGTTGHRKSAATRRKIAKSVSRSREDLAVRVRIARGRGVRPFIHVQSGRVFETIVEAAFDLGLHRSCINNVLHGRYTQTAGQEFRYVEVA
jgi:hypothetical protein